MSQPSLVATEDRLIKGIFNINKKPRKTAIFMISG